MLLLYFAFCHCVAHSGSTAKVFLPLASVNNSTIKSNNLLPLLLVVFITFTTF